MPDYQKGQIYKLWSPQGNDNEIYIGSTVQPLYKRKNTHKASMKCSSKILFEKYDDIRIELIEYFPCNNKQELGKKEGFHIRNNDCINKNIAGRTKKEYIQDNKEKIKEYRNNNKEEKQEYDKEYRENNKDKMKEYYQDNKEKIKAYNKDWYEDNKEQIRKKITCVCGRTISFQEKPRHERTKIHQNFIMKPLEVPILEQILLHLPLE
tara:strand:+ start:610 stop:1233 length:624 start_codon:yes stop_codon:yes gene_type:complete